MLPRDQGPNPASHIRIQSTRRPADRHRPLALPSLRNLSFSRLSSWPHEFAGAPRSPREWHVSLLHLLRVFGTAGGQKTLVNREMALLRTATSALREPAEHLKRSSPRECFLFVGNGILPEATARFSGMYRQETSIFFAPREKVR
jgi:hypothetical protein